MKKLTFCFLIFILLNAHAGIACHASDCFISNVVDNGNGTYTITLRVCIGVSVNWGGTTHFTLTPTGGTFTSISSFFPMTLTSNYSFCDSCQFMPNTCVGNAVNVTATASGSLNLSQTILTYNQISSIPTGCPLPAACNGTMYPFIPDDHQAACIINPDSICWDITLVVNGYPDYIHYDGAEYSFGPDTFNIPGGCADIDTLPQIITLIQHIEKNNSILISPNPATNELRIQSAELRINLIEIYGVDGRRVLSQQPATTNADTSVSTFGHKLQTINVSALNPGIYFVKLNAGDAVQLAKFIKQ
jgi:hypothetical protein